jgi:hypothetical protein
MTPREAARWLQQVDGRLFRTPPRAGRRNAWVAVVPCPPRRTGPGPEHAPLIVALGGSMEEATTAAEHQWRSRLEGPTGPH